MFHLKIKKRELVGLSLFNDLPALGEVCIDIWTVEWSTLAAIERLLFTDHLLEGLEARRAIAAVHPVDLPRNVIEFVDGLADLYVEVMRLPHGAATIHTEQSASCLDLWKPLLEVMLLCDRPEYGVDSDIPLLAGGVFPELHLDIRDRRRLAAAIREVHVVVPNWSANVEWVALGSQTFAFGLGADVPLHDGYVLSVVDFVKRCARELLRQHDREPGLRPLSFVSFPKHGVSPVTGFGRVASIRHAVSAAIYADISAQIAAETNVL